jgi:hypothetical protein
MFRLADALLLLQFSIFVLHSTMVTISKKNNKISSREHSKALIIFLKNTSIVYVHVEAVLRTNTITQTEVFHF